MMLKMEKNNPNANSCLMFTFSVVVLHWRSLARRRRQSRAPPTAHDAVRGTTGNGTAAVGCAREASLDDVTTSRLAIANA